MKKLHLLFTTLVILFSNIQAQTYYGKKMFGRIQTINDSVTTVTFISFMNTRSVDTCYIRKNMDTIFLSTKTQWRHKVNIFDNEQTVSYPCFPWDYPIIKIYKYSYPDKKYEYQGEVVGIRDSLTHSIVILSVFYRGNYIIVYKDFFFYYRVKCSFNNERNFIVLEHNPDYVKGVIFNDFPLLIKGNRLIPIDKEKQMQCWFDNGFFFPKMKMSKKNKKYHVINGHYIGLRNLPTKMEDLEKLKPLPRKNMKYLEN